MADGPNLDWLSSVGLIPGGKKGPESQSSTPTGTQGTVTPREPILASTVTDRFWAGIRFLLAALVDGAMLSIVWDATLWIKIATAVLGGVLYAAIEFRHRIRRSLFSVSLAIPTLMLLFVIGFAYYRPPAAINGQSVSFGFAEATKAPTQPTDLLWNSTLFLQQAFSNIPDCLVKFSPARDTDVSPRNIVAKIVRDAHVCGIQDDTADQGPVPKDVDKPSPPLVNGLIVRWDTTYAPGRKVFNSLKGEFCPVAEGHAIPPNSAHNLIWIVVGDGYPWPRTGSCE